MNCTCTNGCPKCRPEPVIRQVFDCPGTQRVVKHEHIVRHQHDTINEYDVIHEHTYNTRDVVREREVVRHNDYVPHQPNYCGTACEAPRTNTCGCTPMAPRPRFWAGRRW
ncbi:MAG: hypothetical protein FWC16_10585 [Defluviitaleaceae bacterium]|nr:hypothetical protein [Defluviitaleaceae bacterium]MCL2275363.1 hypothetical protein [Defluviitaleaceae bacterium]